MWGGPLNPYNREENTTKQPCPWGLLPTEVTIVYPIIGKRLEQEEGKSLATTSSCHRKLTCAEKSQPGGPGDSLNFPSWFLLDAPGLMVWSLPVAVCAFRLKYSTKEDILSGTLYLSKAPTGCFSSRGFPNQFLLTVQLSDPCSAFSGARCLLPWHLLAVCLINWKHDDCGSLSVENRQGRDPRLQKPVSYLCHSGGKVQSWQGRRREKAQSSLSKWNWIIGQTNGKQKTQRVCGLSQVISSPNGKGWRLDWLHRKQYLKCKY